MDIIISAIACALGNLSSDTVKAVYNKLKVLALRKCGTAGRVALENWEKKPDSPAWKDALLEALQATGADKDAEIIKAAEALLAEVKKQTCGVGMDIGTFKAAELELSRVSAEKTGTAMKIKDVDIEGKATLSDIGGAVPKR